MIMNIDKIGAHLEILNGLKDFFELGPNASPEEMMKAMAASVDANDNLHLNLTAEQIDVLVKEVINMAGATADKLIEFSQEYPESHHLITVDKWAVYLKAEWFIKGTGLDENLPGRMRSIEERMSGYGIEYSG